MFTAVNNANAAFVQTGARRAPRALNYVETRRKFLDEVEGPPAPEGSIQTDTKTYVPEESNQALVEGAAQVGVSFFTAFASMFTPPKPHDGKPAPKPISPILIAGVAIAVIITGVVIIRAVK